MESLLMNSSYELTLLQKILHRHADVFCDLAQQDGGEITSCVEWNSRAPAVGMPELLMRAALTNFLKPQPLQDRNNLAGLENRDAGHSHNFDGLNSDELRLQAGGAVLAQHLDHFLQIRVEFVEGGGLRMCAGKAGNIADIKSSIGATLNHCGIGFHHNGPVGSDGWYFSSLEPEA